MALTASQRKLLFDLDAAFGTRFMPHCSQPVKEVLFERWLGQGSLDINGLAELAEQPNLEDDSLAIYNAAAGALRKVGLKNLGLYILPTESGHTPDLTDPTVGQFYVDLGLPCIISSKILYARRELAGGHSARAVWAPIESDEGDADVGDEIVTAWASGIDYKVGDRRSSGTSGFYVCLQDHTSTNDATATGDPDDENDGWEAYWDDSQSPLTFAGFRGVVTNPSQVSTPADGAWVYDILEGVAYGSRYNAADMVWHGFTPGADEGISNTLGVFVNADEALEEVHFFSTSQTTVAIIDGRLNVLTHWVAPEAGQAEYHWRSRASDATAPFLVETVAPLATRTANAWYDVGDDLYQTLLELDPTWLYLEFEVPSSGAEHIAGTSWVRFASLKSVDPTDDSYVDGSSFSVAALGDGDNTGSGRGALSYNEDNLQVRANRGDLISGTIRLYAIR